MWLSPTGTVRAQCQSTSSAMRAPARIERRGRRGAAVDDLGGPENAALPTERMGSEADAMRRSTRTRGTNAANLQGLGGSGRHAG